MRPNTLTADPSSHTPTALDDVNSGIFFLLGAFSTASAYAFALASDAALACSETDALVLWNRAWRGAAARSASRTRDRDCTAGRPCRHWRHIGAGKASLAASLRDTGIRNAIVSFSVSQVKALEEGGRKLWADSELLELFLKGGSTGARSW